MHFFCFSEGNTLCLSKSISWLKIQEVYPKEILSQITILGNFKSVFPQDILFVFPIRKYSGISIKCFLWKNKRNVLYIFKVFLQEILYILLMDIFYEIKDSSFLLDISSRNTDQCQEWSSQNGVVLLATHSCSLSMLTNPGAKMCMVITRS